MEKMNDLRDLLKHEIQDLYSAEEQIIEAMPQMIEKAKNPELKAALREHLKITEKQKTRLDQVQKLMNHGKESNNKGGLFSRLFGGGGHKCKGTQGLIEEGQKVMGEDMNPEVMDAAIIACAQKIEHYEICGYGTAKAYARELKLDKVEGLLDETLQEEYDADERLTAMAVGRLNTEAKDASSEPSSNTRRRESGGTPSTKKAASASKTSGSSSSSGSKGTSAKKTSAKKGAASKSSGGNARGKAGSKAASGSKKGSTSRSR